MPHRIEQPAVIEAAGYPPKRIEEDAGRLNSGHASAWPHGLAAELVEKLTALPPPPRFNLVRYHGALAPSGMFRHLIIPESESWPSMENSRIENSGTA